MPPACATKIEAIARYSADPARLKLYPVGMTKATILRGTPKASIASIARGSAASDVLVANAIVAGSAMAERKPRSGTRAIKAAGSMAKQRKRNQRDVQRDQQLRQAGHHTQSAMRNGVCKRSAYANRRVVHHDVGEGEHGLRQRFRQPAAAARVALL